MPGLNFKDLSRHDFSFSPAKCDQRRESSPGSAGGGTRGKSWPAWSGSAFRLRGGAGQPASRPAAERMRMLADVTFAPDRAALLLLFLFFISDPQHFPFYSVFAPAVRVLGQRRGGIAVLTPTGRSHDLVVRYNDRGSPATQQFSWFLTEQRKCAGKCVVVTWFCHNSEHSNSLGRWGAVRTQHHEYVLSVQLSLGRQRRIRA